jgi:hypothetical protein
LSECKLGRGSVVVGAAVVVVVAIVVVGVVVVVVLAVAVSLNRRFRRCDAIEDCCAVKGSAN